MAKAMFALSLHGDHVTIMVQQGFVSTVNRICTAASSSGSLSPSLREAVKYCAQSMRSIAISPDVGSALVSKGAVEACITMLEYDPDSTHEDVCIALCHMAFSSLQQTGAADAEREGKSSDETKNGSKEGQEEQKLSIATAGSNFSCHERMVKEGVISGLQTLTECFAEGNSLVQEMCALTLACLVSGDMEADCKNEIVRMGVAKMLVKLSSMRHEVALQYCIATFWKLSDCSEEACEQLIDEGTLQSLTALADIVDGQMRILCSDALAKLSGAVKQMKEGTVSALISLCMAPSPATSPKGSGGGQQIAGRSADIAEANTFLEGLYMPPSISKLSLPNEDTKDAEDIDIPRSVAIDWVKIAAPKNGNGRIGPPVFFKLALVASGKRFQDEESKNFESEDGANGSAKRFQKFAIKEDDVFLGLPLQFSRRFLQ